MAPIGIIVAMLPEAACLVAAPRVGESTHIHADVVLHVCGIGPERAARAAEQLAAQGIAGLMSFGTAGGLHGDLDTGAVLVPERIATTAGTLATHVHWRRHVVSRLTAAGVAIASGDLVEAGDVLATPGQKAAFGTRHGAAAVDMESAAVLRIAADRGLPAVAVRVVLDPVHMDLPAFLLRRTDIYGRAHAPGIVLDLLRSPLRLGDLVRMGRTFKRASAAMRHVGRTLHALHPGHDALTPAR